MAGSRGSTDTRTLVDEPTTAARDVEKANVGKVEARDDTNETHLISFEPNDSANPRNWTRGRRLYIACLASFLNVLVCVGVSGYSTGQKQIQTEFGVSEELATGGLSLYILGFALGPLLLGPISEYVGRRPVYLVSWAVFTIFQIPMAVAQNIRTVLVIRFFQGLSGSTPLANTGGSVHDVFKRDESGLAMAIYTLSSVIGPPFGNAMCGFIAQQKGWRWLYWVNLIVFAAMLPIIYFTMPETRDSIILLKRVKRLRKETGDESLRAPREDARRIPGHFWKTTLVRAVKFLFTEPIVYLAALWNGFLFGVIFCFNSAFGLVFGEGGRTLGGGQGYGWTHSGVVNLSFWSLVLGGFIGFALYPIQERIYQRRLAANGGKSVPEARIISSLVLCWLMPIGLTIFAWTCYPRITFIAPLIGATCFGVGFYSTLNFILNYVSDSYGTYSASALAAIVCVRNLIGAATPLFANYMFLRMTNQGAVQFIGGIALLLCPINFWVYYRGVSIRKASPYCREHFESDE